MDQLFSLSCRSCRLLLVMPCVCDSFFSNPDPVTGLEWEALDISTVWPWHLCISMVHGFPLCLLLHQCFQCDQVNQLRSAVLHTTLLGANPKCPGDVRVGAGTSGHQHLRSGVCSDLHVAAATSLQKAGDNGGCQESRVAHVQRYLSIGFRSFLCNASLRLPNCILQDTLSHNLSYIFANT